MTTSLPQTPHPKVRCVVASRHDKTRFLSASALGLSRLVLSQNDIEARLFAENKRGLPEVYNQAIAESATDPAILVFVHDDVWITDLFIRQQLQQGLKRFQLLGLAGNTKRLAGQPGWIFKNAALEKSPASDLSGTVGHGRQFPPDYVSVYGPSPLPVQLLDGLFLACYSSTLLEHDIRFDPRFDFHFYDLDLCRQFAAKGLAMGTWPISVVHQSGGRFNAAWRTGYARYLDKWGD